MTVPVVIADPERICIDVLTAALGAVVSTDYPDEPLAAGTRHVQVDLEGGDDSDYPVAERAQVRIVCHRPRTDRTQVKADADQCRRILATYEGSATVAGIKPRGARSAVATDNDTGNLMCWILVRVDLKGQMVP